MTHADGQSNAMHTEASLAENTGAVALFCLEVSERGHRQPLARHVTRWPFTVGRAASADCVLTDASVAPQHLRVERADDGRIEVEVLDSVNGVWLGRRHHGAGARFAWPPGQALALGRCQLLLRPGDAALAPTQRWRPITRGQVLLTLLALLGVAALAGWESWLGATAPGALARGLPLALVASFSSLLAWVLAWSVLGKLFTGATAFWTHVRIAALGGVAITLGFGALALLAFAASWPGLTRFESVIGMAMLALLAGWHLRVATPVSPRTLAIGLALAWLAAVGVRLGLQWQGQKRLGDEMYLSQLAPPGWRLARVQPVDAFVAGTGELKAKLQERLQDHSDAPDEVRDGIDGLD